MEAQERYPNDEFNKDEDGCRNSNDERNKNQEPANHLNETACTSSVDTTPLLPDGDGNQLHATLDHQLEGGDDAMHNSFHCFGIRGFVLLCIFLTALTSILLGYDIGIMSGAKLQIKEHFELSDGKVELMVGIMNFISAFGGLVSGRISDFIGRRYTVAIACVLFVCGAVLMAFANTYWVLMVGRVITGLGVGSGLTIAPLYMAELSPKKFRGALVSFNEVAINIGILLGFILGYAFSGMPTDRGWRWMLGIGGFPPVIILVSLIFLPESPRWLVKNGYEDIASNTLRKTCSERETLDTLQAIKQEQGATSMGGLHEFFHPSKDTVKLYIAAFGVNFFQQASGIEALVYYIPEVLEESGVEKRGDQLLANAGVGVVKVLFILVAMRYTDSFGRRNLLMTSAIGMFVAFMLTALSFELGNIFELTLTGICIYMATFSIGWGPMAWVVASEVLPLQVRGVGMGMATFTNRIMSGTIAMSYLSLRHALTSAGTFYLFGAIAVISCAFVFYFIPETKGCSLEDIVSRLHHLPKLSSTVCCRKKSGGRIGFAPLPHYQSNDNPNQNNTNDGIANHPHSQQARPITTITVTMNQAFTNEKSP
eukprot:m.105706 g.105706  ORF g.105706 m.105706 type:complete len:596 (+) comp9136_c1_seq8:175-1962(+)